MSDGVLIQKRQPDYHGVDVPERPFAAKMKQLSFWLAILLLLMWSWGPTEMSKTVSLFTDWRNMAEFGSAFLSPNFHDWDIYASEMLVTIQIAIWGTVLSVIFGIPFAIMSSAIRA